MEELLIHVTIHDTENASKYIPAIRRYGGEALGEIRQKILTGYAVTFNWFPSYNFVDDMNGVDVHANFRALVAELVALGAEVTLYQQFDRGTEEISLKILDNMLQRKDTIHRQLEWEDGQAHNE